TGTISIDSTTADGVHPFIGTDGVKPGFAPLPSAVNGCTNAVCQIFQTGILTPCNDPACQPPTINPPQPPPLDNPNTGPILDLQPPPPNQQVVPPTNSNDNTTPIQINLTVGPTGPVGGTSNGGGGNNANNGGSKPNYGPSPGPGLGRTADEQQYSGVPPPNETRFRNEIVIQVVDTVPIPQVTEAAAKLGLALISTQHLDQTHRIVYRFRIPAKANIRRLIVALEKIKILASVGP